MLDVFLWLLWLGVFYGKEIFIGFIMLLLTLIVLLFIPDKRA